MPERRPLIAGNWKMNKTIEESEAFLADFLPRLGTPVVDVALCPPFLALKSMVELCAQTPILVCAQNMHGAESGAFTGEVSAPMLVELGVRGVVLGHSERRQLFGESDAALAEKVPAAFGAGLQPILCIGETEEQRDGGETEPVLAAQMEADLAELDDNRLAELVVAYEPVWAIGTGRTATPEQAQEAVAHVRAVLAKRGEEASRRVRILYGGSVTPDNAGELLGQPDVDGALVGGASLDPEDFAGIVASAP